MIARENRIGERYNYFTYIDGDIFKKKVRFCPIKIKNTDQLMHV